MRLSDSFPSYAIETNRGQLKCVTDGFTCDFSFLLLSALSVSQYVLTRSDYRGHCVCVFGVKNQITFVPGMDDGVEMNRPGAVLI